MRDSGIEVNVQQFCVHRSGFNRETVFYPQITQFLQMTQIINYLKARVMETGLLFNFGASSSSFKRFVFNEKDSVKSADD